MNFITIGGVPAAGKTYTSKLLAKQNNFLALELEPIRWDFFNNDSEKIYINILNMLLCLKMKI